MHSFFFQDDFNFSRNFGNFLFVEETTELETIRARRCFLRGNTKERAGYCVSDAAR